VAASREVAQGDLDNLQRLAAAAAGKRGADMRALARQVADYLESVEDVGV
jgi:hypothetical protein